MRVVLNALNASAAQVQHAVGHAGNGCVVGDDHGGGAEFAVDALYHFEHQFAGGVVQRAGGFVAQQHFGALDDGARNGHALLLAA